MAERIKQGQQEQNKSENILGCISKRSVRNVKIMERQDESESDLWCIA